MSYIGNPPAEAYTNTVKDTFSGDGSTVAFTLSLPTTTNNVRVVVENVIQDPTVAYGVSGTTLTFTSAPPSGTNNIYVVHLGPAVQTVVPPDSVTITDLNAYADGAAAFTANRATSDGTIIDLQKDGSSVGVIGTTSGAMHFVNADCGIRAASSPSRVVPANGSGANLDNSVDLGYSSVRWKNLYLSGGIYLGGTGSANYLDDYETGSWTPTYVPEYNSFSSITYDGSVTGRYVKVGDIVHLSGFISTDALTVGTANGGLWIGGLPFAVENSPSDVNVWAGSIGFSGDFSGDNPSGLVARRNTSQLTALYRTSANGSAATLVVADMATGTNDNTIVFSVTYRTTA